MSIVHRDMHGHALLTSLSQLYRAGEFSDLLLRCGGREFHIHKAIVCPRSRFFARACAGEFSVREHETPLPIEDCSWPCNWVWEVFGC